jgi:hypothetical protein
LVDTLLALQITLKEDIARLKRELAKKPEIPDSSGLIQNLLSLQEAVRKENELLRQQISGKPRQTAPPTEEAKRNLTPEFQPPANKRPRQRGDTPEVVKRPHPRRDGNEDGTPISPNSDSEEEEEPQARRPNRLCPGTPEQVQDLRKEIADLKKSIASRKTIYLIDGTQEEPTERALKQWDHDLRAWEFKIPAKKTKDLVSINFLIEFEEFVKELNCTVPMAYKRLRLMAQTWKDSRMSNIKDAVSSSADDLPKSTLRTDWTAILAYIAESALPAAQLQTVVEEMEAERYEGILHYNAKIKRYHKLMDLLKLPRPRAGHAKLHLEKVIGMAVKEGRIDKGVLDGFLVAGESLTTDKAITNLLRKLEAAHQKGGQLTQFKEHEERKTISIDQKQQSKSQLQKATASKYKECSHCKMKGHSEETCRTKLYGKACKKCDSRHLTAKCPANGQIKTSQTNATQVVEEVLSYNTEITRIHGIDYVPVITNMTIESKNGEKKIPTVAFIDPGASRSLLSQQYFEKILRPEGHVSYTGPPVLVKGIDHTGDGVRTSEYVDLIWVFPNDHKVLNTIILVPHIPEPIILGRDWQREAGTSTNQGKTPESCYCEIKAGNLKENFLTEESYRNLINPQAARASKALNKKNRKAKVRFAEKAEKLAEKMQKTANHNF